MTKQELADEVCRLKSAGKLVHEISDILDISMAQVVSILERRHMIR